MSDENGQVPDPDADAIGIVKSIAASQRAGFRRKFPLEYDAGFIAGVQDKVKPALRYPPDFPTWPFARRQAWWGGWNEGYTRP